MEEQPISGAVSKRFINTSLLKFAGSYSLCLGAFLGGTLAIQPITAEDASAQTARFISEVSTTTPTTTTPTTTTPTTTTPTTTTPTTTTPTTTTSAAAPTTPEGILQAAIDAGYSKKTTVADLVAPLDFNTAFPQMTTDELLTLLIQRNLVVGYTSASTLKAALPTRLRNYNALVDDAGAITLRPDGLLVAMAVALPSAGTPAATATSPYRGSLLRDPVLGNNQGPALDVRASIQQLFTTTSGKLEFLKAFTPRRMLELLDDRITLTDTAPYQFNGFAWSKPYRPLPYNNFAGSNTAGETPLFYRNVGTKVSVAMACDSDGCKAPLDPAVAKTKISDTALPGQRVLLSFGFDNTCWRLVEGKCIEKQGWVNGSAANTLYTDRDEIDSGRKLTGKPNEFDMLWMNEYEQAMKKRVTEYFTAYKNAGGQLDVLLLDNETIPFNFWYLNGGTSLFGRDGFPYKRLAPTGRKLWDAIKADPRWDKIPDDGSNKTLRQRLLDAGLTDADVANISQWRNAATDMRSNIWNSVMEERWVGYVNRAVCQPLKAIFPKAHCSNYRNYFRNQAFPILGNGIHTQATFYGVGAAVGNKQSSVGYGLNNTLTTPLGTETASPATQTRVSSITLRGNKLTLNGFTDFSTGAKTLKPGDKIVLDKYYVDPAACPDTKVRAMVNNVESSVDVAPYIGGPFTVSSQSNSKTLVVNFTPQSGKTYANQTTLLNVTCSLMVYTAVPYNDLLGMMKSIRANQTTSTMPLSPYVSTPSYYIWGTKALKMGPYYLPDIMFHAALNGAQDFSVWNPTSYGQPAFPPYWTTDGGDDDISKNRGNVFLSQVINEINKVVPFAKRKLLTYSPVSFSDDYVLSGVEAGGKRVWRLTPDPRVPLEIISVKPASFRINGKVVTIPGSELDAKTMVSSPFGCPNIANNVKGSAGMPYVSCGYWITQTAPESNFKLPATELATKLGL